MIEYKPRPIIFIKTLEGEGSSGRYRTKVYGVTARGTEKPRDEIVEFGQGILIEKLMKYTGGVSIKQVPLTVSFGCIHETMSSDFLLTGIWFDQNVILTDVFRLNMNARLRRITRSSASTPLCTWDIAILAHERKEWIDRVLKNPTSEGIDDYLRAVLNTVI